MSAPEKDPLDDNDADALADAARRAATRSTRGAADPEPSLGARLGQMGILGWTIVVPTLLGMFIGRWIDRMLDSGIMYSAALLMLGAAFGLWSAYRWMHRSLRKDP